MKTHEWLTEIQKLISDPTIGKIITLVVRPSF